MRPPSLSRRPVALMVPGPVAAAGCAGAASAMTVPPVPGVVAMPVLGVTDPPFDGLAGVPGPPPPASGCTATGSAPMKPPAVLLSTGAVIAMSRVPAWRIVPPRLSMSPALLSSTFAPSSVPMFSKRPAAVTTKPPTPAPMWPALRTPSPASVPINVILPAYMPPSAATSSAKAGVVPVGATGACALPSTATWLAPVTTLSSLAQSPALSCTARARMAA